MDDDKKQKMEIRQLLLLLGSAVAAAVLFSIFMINFYGPTGQYTVKNILLSPDMTSKLDFYDGVTGGKFTFDRAVFRYYDDESVSWKSVVLSESTYRQLFEELHNETSFIDVPAEVINQFNFPNPATLTLYVKNDKVTKVFQEAVFVKDSDLFRILLRGDHPTSNWAYFHHRKVYDHVLHIIVPAGSP